MSVTVDTLLKLPSLYSGSRLLSDCGLDNIVKHITILETPNFTPANFDKELLVLTTLSAYCSSVGEINRVIDRLCDIPVSAIGIKLVRFVKEIDPSTIQIAREHNVALFSLAPSIYFRDILSEALSVITGNQYLLVNRANLFSQELTNLILNNGSIQSLLELFSREIPCYCCCYDYARTKLAEVCSDEPPKEPLLLLKAIEQFFLRFSFANQKTAPLQEENVFIFPCMIQSQLLAVFCVIASEKQFDLVRLMAPSIISSISVKLLERNSKLQTQRELLSSVMNDILFSRSADASSISERLELLNFRPGKNMLVILLSRTVYDYKEPNQFYFTTMLQRFFESKFDAVLLFSRGRESIALVSGSTRLPASSLINILQKCDTQLSRLGTQAFQIGCSRAADSLLSLSECYQQAKKAIQFGQIVEPDRRIYLYEDYLELGLVAHSAGSSDGRLLVNRIIQPLLDYDEQYHTSLWETLETALLSGSLDAASNSLHIHISTLRYRLHKIETVTGYSYFDNRSRFTLYFAYLLYKIMRNSELMM
ncbi:MAG: hypothetical protein HFE84_07285 [Lachnospiraceae bacterium]|nr:hypothetical protein [Lachnospiraceae bacterium]